MRSRTLPLLTLLVTLAAPGARLAADGMAIPLTGAASTDRAAELRLQLRTLWTDHIIFTRGYIISTLAGLGDQAAVTSRLMQNQDALGASIEPFYGKKAAKRLATLLREHIRVAGEVVAAFKAGDVDGQKIAQADWAANGALLTAFLSKANPWWDPKEVGAMLSDHLATTSAEVDARLKQHWVADIEDFDQLHAHMLAFADYLADGLVKQFPERFLPSR